MAAITRIWILLNLMIMVRLMYSQIPYPMYPHMVAPMQPMFAMPLPLPPPPIPIPMPVPIAIRIEQTSSTSTTTTEQSVAVAVPVPLPMPIHIAVPALSPPVNCQRRPRPYNCPPCPPCMCTPSCTPAFFAYCSPCHQKCKCRSQAPQTYKKKYYRQSSCSDDSYSSYSSSSSSSEWVRARRRQRKRNKRKNLHNMRRNFQMSDSETSGSELIKPVLTYISRNGDIKFKKRLSADEAAQLLGERRSPKTQQNVKVIGEDDNRGKSQILVISNDAAETSHGNTRRQIVLREGTAHHVLGEGKKELIFRPPDDKRISNLSVSFQVV